MPSANTTPPLASSRVRRLVASALGLAAFHGLPPADAAVRPLAAATSARAAATANTAITPLDNYEQWKSALDTGRGVVPPTFTLTPGFEIETLRIAAPDEGSWVTLGFDLQGRLIVAREKRGLLRFTLAAGSLHVEVIDDTLEEVRGLLDTPHGLYANANVSRGLFRLRDTTADGRLDEVRPLVITRSGGHGRNALALAPDGSVAMIHGDAVDFPPGLRRLTPPTVPKLLPGDDLPRGHLLYMDPEGREWTLVASGLRNPVGVDFNPDGEAFTYDADAEMDMGMPWYRPTHVRHLVSGAEFGWRRVTGRWPPYYADQPDNPPTTLVIGKGSPTAVKFGTRSHFPPVYQRALFIMDWAYGRILAVHLTPQGASYRARAETFLRGRPLNVTGLDFGPDGAMYFVTGGRNTQSALYRVRYTGERVPEPEQTRDELAQHLAAERARGLRRELEAFHGRHDAAAISAAWPRLDDRDPWIAHAARVALEHQPTATWTPRAMAEASPSKALPALLALTRVGPDDVLRPVLDRLTRVAAHPLSGTEARVFVRAAGYAVQRLGPLDHDLKEPLIARVDALVPNPLPELNREACRLLIQLEAPGAVAKSSTLLAAATEQEEKLHYLHLLGGARTGWTEQDRARFFRALAQTGSFRGGAGLPRFLREIKNDALATVPEGERARYAALLEAAPATVAVPLPAAPPRDVVKAWTMADLERDLGNVQRNRNFGRGRQLYSEALCLACHRMGHDGGTVGPDLTDVASRFSPRDVLEHTLEPSRVVDDSYRDVTVTTRRGESITGRIVPVDFRLPILRLAADPLAPETAIDVVKDDIVSYAESEVSPMPAGLLDRFTREEILDLLAYIDSGGEAEHRHFVPGNRR
jgi:putative heme-binding domain-containing protein